MNRRLGLPFIILMGAVMFILQLFLPNFIESKLISSLITSFVIAILYLGYVFYRSSKESGIEIQDKKTFLITGIFFFIIVFLILYLI